MEKQRKAKLEEKGFQVGTATDFWGLNPKEGAYIEIRLEISGLIKSLRKKRGWTQQQLAETIGSSQSRYTHKGYFIDFQ